MSSIQSTSATDPGVHQGAGTLADLPDDLPAETSAPPPTAILLGLAFGASAGLLTALYLIFA